MHFDNTETWSTATPTPAAAVDLESVALHEMGHAIGLDHSPDTDAVMYAYLNPGQTKRRLTGGDVVAIRDLYGAAAVVPHASEMTAGNAAKAVKEAGLDFRYSPKWIANAYVIGQTPPEGTRVAAGSIVTLRVRALSGGGGPGNPGGNPP